MDWASDFVADIRELLNDGREMAVALPVRSRRP